MKNFRSKLEVATNIGIIVVALLIVGLLAQRFLMSADNQPPEKIIPTAPSPGAKVNLSSVDWALHPQTVLLVLQKGCHYCTESAPFYQKLIKSAGDKNIKFLAVLPQSREESENYLKELGISGLEIKQSSLGALQVTGTPTLMIINEKGEVTNTWIGRLTPEKEAEVFLQLKL